MTGTNPAGRCGANPQGQAMCVSIASPEFDGPLLQRVGAIEFHDVVPAYGFVRTDVALEPATMREAQRQRAGIDDSRAGRILP